MEQNLQKGIPIEFVLLRLRPFANGVKMQPFSFSYVSFVTYYTHKFKPKVNDHGHLRNKSQR